MLQVPVISVKEVHCSTPPPSGTPCWFGALCRCVALVAELARNVLSPGMAQNTSNRQTVGTRKQLGLNGISFFGVWAFRQDVGRSKASLDLKLNRSGTSSSKMTKMLASTTLPARSRLPRTTKHRVGSASLIMSSKLTKRT